MSQISLPLDWTGREKGETFLLSESNSLAVRHLDHWGIWPVRTTILTGPPRSGRSTLGRLFVRKTGGRVVDDARQAESGRASWRGRVCQYVWISVVGESLKKKKNRKE